MTTAGCALHVKRDKIEFGSVGKERKSKSDKKLGRCSNHSRKNIYLKKTAPTDMRQHKMRKQQRLDTADSVVEEIEKYCDAAEACARDAKDLQDSPNKLDESEAKDKGKMHKGFGCQPRRGE